MTIVASDDGAAKALNDDGSVPEGGLRLAIDEAKKGGRYQP